MEALRKNVAALPIRDTPAVKRLDSPEGHGVATALRRLQEAVGTNRARLGGNVGGTRTCGNAASGCAPPGFDGSPCFACIQAPIRARAKKS